MEMAQYLCNLCRKGFPFKSIRYTRDGSKIVCIDCFDKLEQESKSKEERVHIELPAAASEFVKIFCADCRYKFSLTKGTRITPSCPYCGSARLMKDDVTAQQLVEEASQRMYDY